MKRHIVPPVYAPALAVAAAIAMMVAGCGGSNPGTPGNSGHSAPETSADIHSAAPPPQSPSAQPVAGGASSSDAKACNLMSSSAIDAFTGSPMPNALVPNATADANDSGIDYSCKFEYWSGGALNAGTMTLLGLIEFVCDPNALGNPAVTYPNSRFFKIGSMSASIVVGLNSNNPGKVPASVLDHAEGLAKAEGC